MKIKSLFESKFIKVFDLQYQEGRHYYNATRRDEEDLVAAKSTEEFKKMLPDAVSCVVILKISGQDPEDCTGDNDNTAPLIKTAMRELHEETGLKVTEKDTVSVINPCLFSTPGMTDESNALVKIVLNRDSLNGMSQEGAVGGELFDGFDLLTKAQAKKILEDGVDEHGIYYSVYTWAALTYFVADLWR